MIEGSDLTEDISVKSSENLHLSCIVTGKPEPNVVWLRNGGIIKSLTDFNKTTVNNNYTVSLPALSGKYSCLASNKAGITEKQFYVKVLGKSFVVISKKKLRS